MSTTVETASNPFVPRRDPEEKLAELRRRTPRLAGPARNSSEIGRRACSWATLQESRATGD